MATTLQRDPQVPVAERHDVTLHLTWKSELPRGCVRVGRLSALPSKYREHPRHDHEFAEFMWVESGRCEHPINGTLEYLEAGDFRCIRPHDVHAPTSDGKGVATLVNISFMLPPLAALAERYGADWPWSETGPQPRGGKLSPLTRDRLSYWANILAMPAPRPIDLDCFLVDLVRLLSNDAASTGGSNLPAWLCDGLAMLTTPHAMRLGVPELARICGRSREHINRTVRACQGRRATDLINSIRLDWAASQLHLTDRPLAELAAECGLANLAHFYRLFHAAHGMTPAAWRRAMRSSLPPQQPMNMAPWSVP